jgi:hypothetical protein
MDTKDESHEPETPGREVPTRLFGVTLRQLRESFWERTAQGAPPGVPAPAMRLSAQSLIKCLRLAGHELSSGAYSEIEAGNNLPRDARGFLNAVTTCLRLSEEDERRLTYALVSDLVLPKLGERAREYLQPPTHLAKTLHRWRRKKDLRAQDLADALITAGFPIVDHNDSLGVVDAEDLTHYLELIEAGKPWPLPQELGDDFIRLCTAVLGVEAGGELEMAMRKDLAESSARQGRQGRQGRQVDESEAADKA